MQHVTAEVYARKETVLNTFKSSIFGFMEEDYHIDHATALTKFETDRINFFCYKSTEMVKNFHFQLEKIRCEKLLSIFSWSSNPNGLVIQLSGNFSKFK